MYLEYKIANRYVWWTHWKTLFLGIGCTSRAHTQYKMKASKRLGATNLSQRVYPDRNLPITQRTSPKDEDESSKQRDNEHHASNQSTTILDEHKNLRSNVIR
jgi:hypothetical protein